MNKKHLVNMAMELRRGVIALAVLSQLRQEHYGYSLIKLLNEQDLEIDQGTLYPLLRRLESSGLLKSEWRVEGPRPRRYYQTTKDGKEALRILGQEWTKLVEVMEGLLS
jgi:DNA-binding PadR family transcriptional regulator